MTDLLPTDLVPAKEASRMLGFTHRNTLGKRIKSGEITPIKVKGRNYFKIAEIERYKASLSPSPVIYSTPSKTMLETGEPEGGWPS